MKKNITTKETINILFQKIVNKLTPSNEKYNLSSFNVPFIYKDKIQLICFLYNQTEIELINEIVQYVKVNELHKTEEFKTIENDKLYTNCLQNVNANLSDVNFLSSTKLPNVYVYTNFCYFFEKYYEKVISKVNKKIIERMIDNKYTHVSNN